MRPERLTASSDSPVEVSPLERWSRFYRSGTATDLEVAAWLDDWANACGLVDALDFEGTSLWWFARFPYLVRLLNLLPDVRALEAVSRELDGASMPAFGMDEHWRRVAAVVGRAHDIPMSANSDGRSRPRHSASMIDRVGSASVRIMRVAASMRRWSRVSRQVDVAAVCYSVCKRVSVGGRVRFMEPTFEPLVDELVARGRSSFKLNVPTNGGWRNDLRWLKQADPAAVPVEFPLLAWLARTWPRRQDATAEALVQRLSGALRTIDQTPARWHGFDLGPEIRALSASMLLPRIRRAMREIRFFEDFFRRSRPKVLMLSNEYSGMALAATTAARHLDIPIVAMQHGVIWRAHPGYVLPRTRLSTVPRANRLCVFGAFERDVVIDHGVYAADEVVITGSPRMDLIVQRPSSLTRADLAQRLGLRSDAPIVLFTSTGESRMLAQRLGDSLAASAEPLSLIVKVHPTGEVDPGAFAAMAVARGLGNVRVIGEEIDLYDLLRAVDVHMSMNSTVLTEAAAFDLPNIMLATESAADKVGYLERNVAVRAEDYASLAAAVRDVLHGPASARLRDGRPAFVERQFYRLDGQATVRAADVVDRLIAERT